MNTATLLAICAGTMGAGGAIGYIIARAKTPRSLEMIEAKKRAIESEAELLSRDAQMQKERILEAANQEASYIKAELEKKHQALRQKERALENSHRELELKQERFEQLEERKQKELLAYAKRLEGVALMTQSEAKEELLRAVEERSKDEMTTVIAKYERLAKEEGKRKANYILAQATSRYAGEFAGERLVSIITLPTDDHKGRIIGKEGRNIKSLEMLLGVDIIIDETPSTIMVSSFNIYRRAIAAEVIERLIADGRVHPGRIEQIHQEVEREFEQRIFDEGKEVVMELGIYGIADELVSLIGKLKYRSSYGQNALKHSLEVARLAKVMAAEMGGDELLALRAGLLHDIGKALTQDMGGSHVDLGAEVCRRYGEPETVINAIYAHHGHAEPDGVESAAVCAADALSAARPGARREVLESFARRVEQMEKIALNEPQVLRAYAINAGREIRVFVDTKKSDDAQTVALCKKIAKQIEKEVQFPGEIKVEVLRQSRSVAYAKH